MKKHLAFMFIMILVLAIICPKSFAVKPKKDPQLVSLETTYKNTTNKSEKVKAGIALAQYSAQSNNNNTETYANDVIKIAKAAKMDKSCAELYSIIGNYYFNTKNYRKAVTAFESEYIYRKKLQQAKQRAITCYNIGFCYNKLGFQKKAKKYYEESMSLAKKLGNKELIDRLTRSLSDVSVQQHNYKDAYEYLNKYLKSENKRFQEEYALLQEVAEEQEQKIVKQDSTIKEVKTQNEELEIKKEELEAQNKIQAQQLEIKELENKSLELQKENRDLTIKVIIFILLSILIALFFIIRASITRKRTTKQLQEKNAEIQLKNDEISKQNEEITAKNEALNKSYEVIEMKNKDITDSITYASKIQKAMLRDFANYSKLMTDYFIFYAPKDIVSGDFYWAHRVDDKFVFTVGDCTGHSVPGAFMSMLGIALLNQIVAQQHETQASKILEQMRALVKSYLGQTGMNDEPKDGMDMSLCVWDLKENKGNYSGAYNPLWQIRDGQLNAFAPQKCPVGVHNREVPFVDNYFDILKGDKYYMFSDGYSDQFGATSHEKFKTMRFKKLLTDTCTLTMTQQGDLISKNYYDWKGDFIQIDDVCVLGIEI